MIKLRDDVLFEDPESRIREYCRIEIYSGYDDKHSVNNDISQEDIQNANNLYAMIDRYDKTESRRLLNNSERISKLLSEIPDIELLDVSDEEWPKIKNRISDLFHEFLSLKGVGLAKTTKILHLKRPKLIPVFDSYVIKFLLGIDISGMLKRRQVELGLEALERAREIIVKQKDEFKKLVQQTRDLPIPLSFVRMFDILCWTTEKWDIRGILNAPHGTPHKSLLKLEKPTEYRCAKNEELISSFTKILDKKNKCSVKESDTLSDEKQIVMDFMNDLIEKADYGIRGEKPLAIIAALKYLNTNNISGKTLSVLFPKPRAGRIRRTRIFIHPYPQIRIIFTDLVKQSGSISDPSASWNNIVSELPKSIGDFNFERKCNINQAFSKLTLEEICSLLEGYMKSLQR